MILPRLRQAVLVAPDLAPAAEAVQSFLDLSDPYHDPGVAAFGLENAVFSIGDTFLEIVSPVQAGTTAGRYLERRGSAAGYMAIFQVADMMAARRRVADLGVRVVWQADLPDISGTHLHPKDVPGAIVSIDAADPVDSWRWAGPDWTATPPAPDATGPAPAWTAPLQPGGRGDGLVALTVRAIDPAATARRWSEVLDVPADGTQVRLCGADQTITFVGAEAAAEEGISTIQVTRRGRSKESLAVGRARIVIA